MKKRFELVMDEELFSSVSARAKVEGKSVGAIIRDLLALWDGGEILTDRIENKPIERIYDDEIKFYSKANGLEVYNFTLLASRHGLTRIELFQLLIGAVNSGRIDIDRLLCDCYQ